MLILDTHVLVWLDQGSNRLGKNTLKQIDKAYSSGNLNVCSISFWEITMLVEKKRLELQQDVSQWRQDLLNNGLKELQLSGDVGITAGKLVDFDGDPADRIITSTALTHSATLCTADHKILNWKPNLNYLDATK